MLTKYTQAAIALLQDIALGDDLQSANFLLSKADLSKLFGQLEAGGLIRRLPHQEERALSSYKLCRPLPDLSLLDVLQAIDEPIHCNQPTPETYYSLDGVAAKKVGVLNQMVRMFLSEIKMTDW